MRQISVSLNTLSRSALSLFVTVLLLAGAAQAQTTAFTYQGRLGDTGMPATGSYDFQFKLFDTLTGGTQIGVIQSNGVAVTSGVFNVTLDFGASAFPGAARFLEISVRLAGGGAFTTLTPRRPLNSVPYAVQSLNAATATNATTATNFSGALAGDVTGTQAATTIANNAVTTTKLADGSVTNAKIVDVAGSKVTGTIPVAGVPAGSGNYIQNTTTQQAGSNFNISGDGTAGGTLSGNIVNATTQFNLNGSRVLSRQGTENLFVGLGTGAAITTGQRNSFVGHNAGLGNTVGESNSFFGFASGTNNVSGVDNSFFGSFAGNLNTASGNSFFGRSAGGGNTTGDANSSFGKSAGQSNATGGQNSFFGFNAGFATTNSFNSFFGYSAGSLTSSGSLNTFIGHTAGGANTTGSNNTIIGAAANVQQNNLINATAIGNKSVVNCSNCLVLGSVNGENGATSNVKVGIGTPNPVELLHVGGDLRIGDGGNPTNGCIRRADATIILGSCSSDLRFKRDISPFLNVLPKLTRLQPVHFYWRAAEFPAKHFGNTRSYGLIAQEVEEVLPELVTEDEQGYKKVNYSKLPLLTIQAIKELKAENDALKKQNAAIEARLAALEKLLQPAAPGKK